MNKSESQFGAPPAPPFDASKYSKVIERPDVAKISAQADHAAQYKENLASDRGKPDSPMGAATKSNVRNYGGYNGPVGNVK